MRAKTNPTNSKNNRDILYVGIFSIFIIALLFGMGACSQSSNLEARYSEIEAERVEFEDKLYQLPDSPLRYQLRLLGEDFFFLAEMEFAVEELKGHTDGPRYEHSPLAYLSDYPSIEAMHEAYMNGLIFKANSVTPEMVFVKEPFEHPFGTKINWKAVTFSDGQVVDFEDSSGNLRAAPVELYDDRGLKLLWESGEPLQALALSGSVEVNMPADAQVLSFTSGDRNDWKQMGNYRIRLVEMAEQHVRFEVQDKTGKKPNIDDDDFILGAKDNTGKYLQFLGGGTGTPEEIRVLILGLNRAVDAALAGDIPTDISADDLNLKLIDLVDDQKKPIVATMDVYFNGDVQAIDLLYNPSVSLTEFEFAREAVDFSSPDARDAPIQDIPINAIAFDHERESFLQSIALTNEYDLTAKQVAQRITHNATRDNDGFIRIGFSYPKMPSSVFLNSAARFGFWEEDYSLTAFNKSGEVIEPSYTAIRFSEGQFEIDRTAYEEEPYRAKGHITVKIAPEMKAEQLEAVALPDGIIVGGNKVIADPEFISHDLKVFAVDENGRALKIIEEVLYPRDNLYQSVTYYYGEPSALIVLREGELQNIRYEFDVVLDESINLPGATME